MRRLCRWRQLRRCMSWTPCSTSLGILLTTSDRMFPTITPFLVSWHNLHHLFLFLLLRSSIWNSPPFDLYCFISPSFPPGWRRLSGISLWHIVRPILLNSSFSLTFYHPYSSTYLLSICLLPLTTPHLLVTSQPLYPTLFKVNSHNFIYTFILLWGKKEGKKKTSYSPSLTYPSVVRHTGSQHSLAAPFSNHWFRAPARYLLTTTPSPFLLHNSPYPILYCPLTTPPAAHSFALFGVLPLRRAFACHHFEPLLE